MIVDELIAVLGYDLRGEDDRRRFQRGLDALNNRVRAFSVAATRAAVIAGGALAAGMGIAGRTIIKTAAEFEGFEVQLKTIEGSAEAAEKSLAWITQFGKTTPYEVAGITDAFVRLKAQGIDPIANDSLRTLGDAASAMNKPLMQAVEAFTDASTFQFERLKEFGITSAQAGDQVTFQFTKNGETIKETVKKDGEEIRRFLLENFGGRFAGAMDEQSRTFNGMMSNLSDSWTDFQRKIADAGFFKAITSRLQGLLDWIDRMDANGNLAKWAQSFSDALVSVIDGVTSFAARIKRHFDTIMEIISNNSEGFRRWRGVILGVLAALAIYIFPVTALFLGAAAAVEDFLTWLGGGESVIGSFIEWLKKLPGELLEAASAFGDWISNVDWEELGATAARNLVDALIATAIAVLTVNSALGEALVEMFTDIDWVGVGLDIGQGILDGLKAMGEFIKGFFLELFPIPAWLSGAVEGAPDPGSAQGPRPYLNNGGRASFLESAAEAEAGLGAGAVASSVNDSRDQSTTQTITVNQNVQQATDAPGAAAEATGRAVGSAARKAARVQAEGAR